MPVHQRSCRPGHAAKPIGSNRLGEHRLGIQASQNQADERPVQAVANGGYNLGVSPSDGSSTVSLVACPECGRKFAADRIEIHQKVCQTHHAKEAKRMAKIAAKVSRH